MTATEEILDINFSLFNGHINNASEKAKKAFIKRFNQEEWDKHIQPFEDNGIMTIFAKKPNRYTLWYVETVAVFVNENRGE